MVVVAVVPTTVQAGMADNLARRVPASSSGNTAADSIRESVLLAWLRSTQTPTIGCSWAAAVVPGRSMAVRVPVVPMVVEA